MNDLEMEALLFLGPPTVSNTKKNTSSNETTVLSKKHDNNNDGSIRGEKVRIADQQQNVYHVLISKLYCIDWW